MDEMIKRLMDKLSAANERRELTMTARKALLDTAEAEKREALSEEEDVAFRAKTTEIAEIDTEIAEIEVRLTELQGEAERTKAAHAAAARAKAYSPVVTVGAEELTYRKNGRSSFVADMARSQMTGDNEARERLQRHGQEVRTAPEYKETRAWLDRVDGTGGFFVPPAWLMDQWIPLARAGRPTADLIGSMALPPGTDSINIPKVTTGTATAIQTADNATVALQDMADTSISVPVRTIAGQENIAIQLLDQSPLNFDEIVFRDLLADYATKTNVQVISGSGASGQCTGLLTQASTISVAASAVTGIGVYSAVANATQQVHAARFASPRVLVMHPRRWAWLSVQVDAAGRPLVVPTSNNGSGQVNALGVYSEITQQTVVGYLMGLPVISDPSIPTNLGGGTNEDVILVLRPEDLLFYESSIRSRVLPQTLGTTLTVAVQVYGYVAFSAARYPAATAKVTGLTTPAF